MTPALPGTVTYRPAVTADYTAAYRLATAAHDLPPALATAADFALAVAEGGVWGAWLEGELLGLLVAQPIAYDGERPYTLWVELVLVAADRRRQGLATALYRHLGAWAEQAGAQAVLTHVPATIAAVALHRRIGFVPHREALLLWRISAVD